MRVAVIGGTGLVGRHTSQALRHAGHDAVVVARSTGTDVTTGAGLDAALAAVEAVIDVGVDRIEGHAHFAGKRRQEGLAQAGPIPVTIVRATLELAGPETQDLVDMARRTLTARGESIRLIPTWRSGLFSVEVAGEVLLPGLDAQLAPTTFDAWLAAEAVPTA